MRGRILQGMDEIVDVLYTNWRGETAWRRIIPAGVYLGQVEWHPGEQWLLDCRDLDRLYDNGEPAARTYAVGGIERWEPRR